LDIKESIARIPSHIVVLLWGIFRTDQVSLSAFAYLYSELVQYHQGRVSSLSELEQKLMGSGYGVGFKILELLAYRSREVSWFHKLLFQTRTFVINFHSSHGIIFVWRSKREKQKSCRYYNLYRPKYGTLYLVALLIHWSVQ
jgi:hypothetical protein